MLRDCGRRSAGRKTSSTTMKNSNLLKNKGTTTSHNSSRTTGMLTVQTALLKSSMFRRATRERFKTTQANLWAINTIHKSFIKLDHSRLMLVNKRKFNNSLKRRNNYRGSVCARKTPWREASREYVSMTRKLKLRASFTAAPSKPRNNYQTS